MKNAWDGAIINARRIGLKDMIVPKERGGFIITKDFKAGKLVFTNKKKKKNKP